MQPTKDRSWAGTKQDRSCLESKQDRSCLEISVTKGLSTSLLDKIETPIHFIVHNFDKIVCLISDKVASLISDQINPRFTISDYENKEKASLLILIVKVYCQYTFFDKISGSLSVLNVNR